MLIKELRCAAGMTQQELARKACVSRSAISDLECGKYLPSPRLAGRVSRAISSALGVSLNTWDIFPEHFKRIIPIYPKDHSHCRDGKAQS